MFWVVFAPPAKSRKVFDREFSAKVGYPLSLRCPSEDVPPVVSFVVDEFYWDVLPDPCFILDISAIASYVFFV